MLLQMWSQWHFDKQ